jgi:hypothetical protein
MTVLNTQQHKQAGFMGQIRQYVLGKCKDAALKDKLAKVRQQQQQQQYQQYLRRCDPCSDSSSGAGSRGGNSLCAVLVCWSAQLLDCV